SCRRGRAGWRRIRTRIPRRPRRPARGPRWPACGCWGDRQEIGPELLAAADVDWHDPIRKPGLLEEQGDLVPVRGGPVMKVDHAAAPCHGRRKRFRENWPGTGPALRPP